MSLTELAQSRVDENGLSPRGGRTTLAVGLDCVGEKVDAAMENSLEDAP
jgi:hypothetical protein